MDSRIDHILGDSELVRGVLHINRALDLIGDESDSVRDVVDQFRPLQRVVSSLSEQQIRLIRNKVLFIVLQELTHFLKRMFPRI